MSKIIFLDIDGPVLPGRAYSLPWQTKPIVKAFDPCSVALLNSLCRETGFKVVIHSSWLCAWKDGVDGPGSVHDHCINEGILAENFHEDHSCNPDSYYRYGRIDEWLARHPETEDFVVLDDVSPDNGWPHIDKFKLIDFDEGITMKVYHEILTEKA